jgi:NhaA family Na+:H+ antiporter
MTHPEPPRPLAQPVDEAVDHILGPLDAEITVVEYGSYACPYCRAANEEIARVRDCFGDRLRYVFRHRPIAGNDLALRAAELAERADEIGRFWEVHVTLMTRSASLTEEDLAAVADDLRLAADGSRNSVADEARARARVKADTEGASASGVGITPTFFINGQRYDGPWDVSSFSDAMLGGLGYRVQAAAINFAGWGPSAGFLLLIATIVAIILSNSPFGPSFEAILHQDVGIVIGSGSLRMSVQHWINDGLLTVFFLVVGLEIKREMTVGRLASRSTAALPIAAAIGGMAAPALIYRLIIPDGPWSHGWGVPIATDTAFAVALIVTMGRRVPVELRIFLTAAAIVDDISSIVVVALFYSGELHLEYMAGALVVMLCLIGLSRTHVYWVSPYLLLGVLLWGCVLASGLHATLAGVLLALVIPTRPPANLKALMAQADTIVAAEARAGEALRHGPSLPALRALDAIHDRIESPADRLLRHAGARSSYLILPIFALANAGVELNVDTLSGHGPLMLAIILGLFIGKPLGMISACMIAVRLGLAVKPEAYSWRELSGAGALAGIGFTMSLFIAGQAFYVPVDFAAAKVAVFMASILSAVTGTLVLCVGGIPVLGRNSPLTQEVS